MNALCIGTELSDRNLDMPQGAPNPFNDCLTSVQRIFKGCSNSPRKRSICIQLLFIYCSDLVQNLFILGLNRRKTSPESMKEG